MDEPSRTPRRRFLAQASTAAVGAAGALGSDCGPPCAAAPVASGMTVGAFPVGSFRAGGAAPASFIVARDAGGFYAYSNVCTHQACVVPLPSCTPLRSVCPCHDSAYDTNGDIVRTAIANQPSLDHYGVSFTGTGDAAAIVVDPDTVVTDRAARVRPPP